MLFHDVPAVSYTHLRANDTLYMIWYDLICIKKFGVGGAGGGVGWRRGGRGLGAGASVVRGSRGGGGGGG
ncbi:hypothetical protein ACQ4LK_24930, partial [Bacillus pumilus]